MPTLAEARNLGGLGSVLMLLSFAPAIGGILAFVGAILVIVAIKYISDIVSDPSIFRNMLIAIACALAGVVVGVLVVFSTIARFIGFGWIGGTPPTNIPPGDVIGLVLGIFSGLALIWILLIVSSVFVRMSYSSISRRLGVGMFGTAGLLYMIGAILSVVLIGFVLIFVALVLNIVAFFSIHDQLPTVQPTQPPTP